MIYLNEIFLMYWQFSKELASPSCSGKMIIKKRKRKVQWCIEEMGWYGDTVIVNYHSRICPWKFQIVQRFLGTCTTNFIGQHAFLVEG